MEEILKIYQKCVNDIDDYLEYRYRFHTAEDVRNNVRDIIDQLTDKLKKRQNENK